MRILNLTLTKKWFDLIISGEKIEEYRDIKPYWIARFAKCKGKNDHVKTGYFCKKANCLSCLKRGDGFIQIKFDAVRFSNGYGRNRPSMTIQLKGIRIDFGNVDHGAPPDEKVFVLSLGRI